ncbi:hypothetical protein PM082_000797 [Marasmius tenuissimus]|nr:hypothetical protein PM082_000797 [Marasmius tenuissimus]
MYGARITPVLPPLFHLFFSTASLPLVIYVFLVQPYKFSSVSTRKPRTVTVIFPQDLGPEERNDIDFSSPPSASPHGSCKKSYSLDIPSPVTITLPGQTHTHLSLHRGHSLDFPVRLMPQSRPTGEPRTPPRTSTRTRTRTASTTPPRILFPHQRMPSSSARSVTSTLSLPRASHKLSFWICLLLSQISALLSQTFEVARFAFISSISSESDLPVSQAGTNGTLVSRHTLSNFSVSERTDRTVIILGFVVNLSLIISVGCVMSALLAYTFVPAPSSSRGRHPHTQTVYVPSTHSHSPRCNSVRPPPRKHSNIPDDTGATTSGTSQRRLIPNARPEMSETSLDYPDPNSALSHYVSNIPSPWTPGTPPKHKSTQSDTVLCAGTAQTPLTSYPRRHQQREGVDRHFSTVSSYDRDIRSTAIPPTPLQKEHISVYLDEGTSMPATPPLTKDTLQTPPSTGLPRTPPSLKDHIRSLALARPQPLTRTHSNTSSFESPGVASLSMRLDKDGRFYGHDDDDDKYTMPPSPTPAARRRKLAVPVVRVDVHEEVAVSDSELPARPRTTIETGPTSPARRRLPRRPWTSGEEEEERE